MRTGIRILVLLICSFLLACQSPSLSVDEDLATKRLVVIDSIGVDYGIASEMFGDITGALFINDSTIVVFDKGYQELRVFDQSCNHLFTRNYSGNGPFEYQYAENIGLGSNMVGIFESKRPPRCIFLNQLLTPEYSATLNETRSLDEPCILNDSTVTGYVRYYTLVNDIPVMGINLCTWDTITGERKNIIYTRTHELSSLDDGYGVFVSLEASVAASSIGKIFVASNKTDFDVLVYSGDGFLLDTINIEDTSLIRDPEEIEQELIWRKLRDGDIGSWSPDENELGVIDLQVQDSLGYLWICSGSYFNPRFTVYDVTGDLAFTCTCEGLPENEMLAFGITDFGIVAYTMSPATYPRLYILELR